jgi:hypothetical protein
MKGKIITEITQTQTQTHTHTPYFGPGEGKSYTLLVVSQAVVGRNYQGELQWLQTVTKQFRFFLVNGKTRNL